MQYAWTVADLNTTSAGGGGRAATVAGWSWGRQLAEQIALQGIKVMVIDDSNTIRRSAEIFLLQAGCTVILADAAAWKPDLLVLGTHGRSKVTQQLVNVALDRPYRVAGEEVRQDALHDVAVGLDIGGP